MKQIKLLDCTLRDGGYINDWKFGKKNIEEIIHLLEKSGTDIIDLGFLKNELPNENRVVFDSVETISRLINKKEGVIYAAMSEVFRPMPPEKICTNRNGLIDVVRVIIWKDKHDETGKVVDCLQEGYEYCRMLSEKGYPLYIQPARVEQYSDDEFISMLELFGSLKPKAIYIVDSWGTMYGKEVLHYLEIANRILDKRIAVGFHGHNNLMQAFSNAVDFINADVDRELIVDSSVFGMGRGAGNLHTELIAKYLNEYHEKNYHIENYFDIYEKCIKDIKQRYIWGFIPAYYFTAKYHANPQYGTYYGIIKDVDSTVVNSILKEMSEEDRVLYTAEKAEYFLKKYAND